MGFNDFIGELGEKIVGRDEYYEDEYYEDEEEEIFDEPEERRGFFRRNFSREEENVPVPTATHAASTVVLIEPVEFTDAPLVCDKLKAGITVVVNMDRVKKEDKKKIFDFLSGAVYVLGASMKRIARNVFILAPYGVEVETQESVNNRTQRTDLWDLDI